MVFNHNIARRRNLNSIPIPKDQRKVASGAAICNLQRVEGGASYASGGIWAVRKEADWIAGDQFSVPPDWWKIQITRSLPPSTGICAPVVFENSGPVAAQASAATSAEVISTPNRLLALYSSTLIP